MDSARVLTVTGPGGAGKSPVTMQVASDLLDAFNDGVWLWLLAVVRVAERVGEPIRLASASRTVDPFSPMVVRRCVWKTPSAARTPAASSRTIVVSMEAKG